MQDDSLQAFHVWGCICVFSDSKSIYTVIPTLQFSVPDNQEMKNPIKLVYRLKYIERYESYVKSKHIPLAIILIIANILGGLVFGYALGTIGGALSSATSAFFPSATNSSSNTTVIRSVNIHHHHDAFPSFFSNIRSSFIDRFVLDFPSVAHPSANIDDQVVESITSFSSSESSSYGGQVIASTTLLQAISHMHDEMVSTLFNIECWMNLFVGPQTSSAHNSDESVLPNSSVSAWWSKFKIKAGQRDFPTPSLFMINEQNSTSQGTTSSSSSDLGTTLLQGLFASSIFIGGLAGCLFSMFTGAYLGRKVSMLVCCLTSMLGAIGASASYTYAALIVFRCFIGFGAGVSTAVCSVYVAELMPFAKYQGVLGGMYNLGVATGIALGYAFGAIFVRTSEAWRGVHAIHNIWCILLFFLVLLVIPESPQFLESSEKNESTNSKNIELEDKKQSIQHTEHKENTEQSASSEVKTDHNMSTMGALKRLFCSKVIVQLILGCYSVFALEWSGIQSATMFTPSLLESAGVTDALNQQLASLGISIWQILTVFPNIFLIDRFGRKSIVLFGMTVCFLTDIAEGFIFQFCENGTDYKIILALVFICIFLLGFNVGIGSLCYILAHEVFNGENEKVVMYGTAISTLTMWVTTIVLSLFFIPVVSATSQAVPWFIFAGLSLFGLLLFIFVLKETSPTLLAKRAEKKKLKEEKEGLEKEVKGPAVITQHVEPQSESTPISEKQIEATTIVDHAEPTSQEVTNATNQHAQSTEETAIQDTVQDTKEETTEDSQIQV